MSGYDYSCGTYSPEGRIYQIEYAQKAVENSVTSLAICCNDGIVLAIGKAQTSCLLLPQSNRKIFSVHESCGILFTGYHADGHALITRSREEVKSYKDLYNINPTPFVLSKKLAYYMHYFTKYPSLRPFGINLLIAGKDYKPKYLEYMKNKEANKADEEYYNNENNQYQGELYSIDTAGTVQKFFGYAIGKGKNNANTELEKLLNQYGDEGISCKQAVLEAAKILHIIRDPSKDKGLELEISWLGVHNNWTHQHIPAELLKEADDYGKSFIGEKETKKSENSEEMNVEEERSMDVSNLL